MHTPSHRISNTLATGTDVMPATGTDVVFIKHHVQCTQREGASNIGYILPAMTVLIFDILYMY